jgi:hypothetical protein
MLVRRGGRVRRRKRGDPHQVWDPVEQAGERV